MGHFLNEDEIVIHAPLVRNRILVNRLALTCFYVGSQFETKTDQSSYVPKIFYELILINGSFVDSLLGCHWMKLLSTPDTKGDDVPVLQCDQALPCQP